MNKEQLIAKCKEIDFGFDVGFEYEEDELCLTINTYDDFKDKRAFAEIFIHDDVDVVGIKFIDNMFIPYDTFESLNEILTLTQQYFEENH